MIRVQISVICCLAMSWSCAAENIQIVQKNGQPATAIVVTITPTTTPMNHTAQEANASNVLDTVISQKDKKFAPYLTVVQTGSRVTFENQDNITHHIYSLNSDQRFDFKLQQNEKDKYLSFKSPQKIAMGCNIHDWMAGHILVVNTPYFSMSNELGSVHLKDIPSGEYELAIYHPQLHKDDATFRKIVQWPLNEPIQVSLMHPMLATPKQQSMDEFDFLEGY